MNRSTVKSRRSARLPVKLAAGIGYIICVWLLMLCVFGIVFLVQHSAFSDQTKHLNREIMGELVVRDVEKLKELAKLTGTRSPEPAEQIQRDLDARYSPDTSNFLYTVYDARGMIVYSNGIVTDGTALVHETIRSYDTSEPRTEVRHFSNEADAARFENDYAGSHAADRSFYTVAWDVAENGRVQVTVSSYDAEEFTLKAGVRPDYPAKDRYYYVAQAVRLLEGNKAMLVLLAFLSFGLGLMLLGIRMCGAGRRARDSELHLLAVDQYPLELFVAGTVLAALLPELLLRFTPALKQLFYRDYLISVLVYQSFTICRILMTLWLMLGLARRWKAHSLMKNSLLYYLLAVFSKSSREYLRASYPFLWRLTLIWVLLSGLELAMILGVGRRTLLAFWVLSKVVLAVLGTILVGNLNVLDARGRALRDGEFDKKVDLNRLLPGLRQHGENLNRISEGMKKNVDEQMRSERMKTELITNVSHDIKTPLTSIITYVDLLKKAGLQSPEAASYLDVLDRQSVRLKKRIDDLVEVSRAATGDIRVERETVDANLLLSQALGEYADRMQARELELIADLAPELPGLDADPKLLWRVLDNLLSNVLKYAQPKTRVYVTSSLKGKELCLVFRNVSAQKLNIAAEDLVERFVRGDLSRSTDGSGLGLSIARSLTELQGGVFDLFIDGDLFKVTLRFPSAPSPDGSEAEAAVEP